ncbi:MAG: hypothetical protein IT361_09960 [Gemmatimonadaceae bacterium]|nr:hypothetical protein [Gemmatimonadaceae bacterium]
MALRAFILCLPLALPGLLRTREPVVEYRTFQVVPDTLRVPVGTTVRWVNRDQIEHTVTGGTPEAPVAGWNIVLAAMDRVGTRTFARAGRYDYFCDRHRFMKGTVIVTPTR